MLRIFFMIICFPFLEKKNAPPQQDESWNMDRIPEIMDGKNVADFVDDDIDAKLALLEKEEDQLQVRSPIFYNVLTWCISVC